MSHHSWKRKNKLKVIIEKIRNQTYKNLEIIVICSNIPQKTLNEVSQNVTAIYEIKNMPEYLGHDKRSIGVHMATGKFLGFFSDDDDYSPKYIEKLVKAIKGRDLAFSWFTSRFWHNILIKTRPKIHEIAGGCFLVRSKLAKKIGYRCIDFVSDGRFVEDLVRAGAKFKCVPEILHVNH